MDGIIATVVVRASMVLAQRCQIPGRRKNAQSEIIEISQLS